MIDVFLLSGVILSVFGLVPLWFLPKAPRGKRAVVLVYVLIFLMGIAFSAMSPDAIKYYGAQNALSLGIIFGLTAAGAIGSIGTLVLLIVMRIKK